MSDKQTPDRKRASPSAPRRVEKVGEAQLIHSEDSTLPAENPSTRRLTFTHPGLTMNNSTGIRRARMFHEADPEVAASPF